MVEASAFQSIGRSWPGFWIFFLRFVVISVPLAYVLTEFTTFSINGVWIAIAAGNIIAALIGYVWIMRAFRTLKLDEVPVHVHVSGV